MPRGTNPNSLKALDENRHKGSFDSESSLAVQEKAREARRQRKTFREQIELALAAEIPLKDKDGNVVRRATVHEVGIEALARKYAKGDVRVAEFFRDTTGEKPTDTLRIVDPDFTLLDEIDWS